MSRELVEEPRGWVCRRERPGPGWLGHGYTRKRLILLAENQLASVVVHKQRWRNPTTGQTVHDRPLRDVAWAHYGLAVVFAASWTWMTAPRGLHHVEWAWPEARPSLRTVQRWMARLLADALAWQVAIRALISDHLAPTPLEERFPAGLPPPGGVARWRSSVPQARRKRPVDPVLAPGTRRGMLRAGSCGRSHGGGVASGWAACGAVHAAGSGGGGRYGWVDLTEGA